MYLSIFSKVCVLFIVFGIGAIARFRNAITEESMKDLCKVVLVVTLPFLYFSTLAGKCTPETFRTIWNLPVFAIVFVMLAYVLARFLSRFVPLSRDSKNTFIYLSTFTNCGFLAIPIAHMLYGPDGVLRVVLFNIGFNMLYWTVGVATLRNAGSRGMAKNLINSGTIGLLLGLLAGLLAVSLPDFVMEAAGIVGSATIPLALLVIGALMAGYKGPIPHGHKRTLALIVVTRLIIVPLAAVFVTKWCTFLPPLSRAIIVLQCAMPSASTTPIFVKRCGGDLQLAGMGVFVTTICSIITIPIIMALL